MNDDAGDRFASGSERHGVHAIERPDRSLLAYSVVSSLALGPFFLFSLIPAYLRYRTLRYRFDDEGVSMTWGALFRREIHLTYSRIQDIHLTSNVLERWLGLARLQVQTASGQSKAEMTIEGLENLGEVRDFLYSKMRGMKEEPREAGRKSEAGGPSAEAGEVATVRNLAGLEGVLREIATELRQLREELAAQRGREGGGE